MTDIRQLFASRIEAAALALGRGDRSEAERLYSEALSMGEESFGADSPELAVPLNELSRLYVRLAEHARAEPLLQRLLKIRRSGGDNHPDVATVLAGLAAVRRGLGDDATAEKLYREALKIREAVHPRGHMAIVVALEHLADTCVATGKTGEATALYERALPDRVKMLGPDHPTVRALRERMMEIALSSAGVVEEMPPALRDVPPATHVIANAAPAPASASAAASVSAPVPAPASAAASASASAPTGATPVPAAAPDMRDARMSSELVFLYEPEKPKRRASVKRDRAMTPPFSMAVAAASMITAPAQAPAQSPAPPSQVAAPSVSAAPSREVHATSAAIATEAQVVRDMAPRRSARVEKSRVEDATPAQARSKALKYGLAAGGLAAMAGVLLVASTRYSGHSQQPAATSNSIARQDAPVATSAPSAPVATPVAPTTSAGAAAAMVAAVRADTMSRNAVTLSATTRASIVTSPKSTQGVAAPQSHAPSSTPSAPVINLPTLGAIAAPVAVGPNVDSVLRASHVRKDIDKEQITSAGRLSIPTIGDDRAETSPSIMGAAPRPRYPDALRGQGLEGTVVVQFLVGADGHVDASSMKVVRSPHELFTAAVRNVLPNFRFTPARGADGKARAEWVQYNIDFSVAK